MLKLCFEFKNTLYRRFTLLLYDTALSEKATLFNTEIKMQPFRMKITLFHSLSAATAALAMDLLYYYQTSESYHAGYHLCGTG